MKAFKIIAGIIGAYMTVSFIYTWKSGALARMIEMTKTDPEPRSFMEFMEYAFQPDKK